jgi:hypothetical protein
MPPFRRHYRRWRSNPLLQLVFTTLTGAGRRGHSPRVCHHPGRHRPAAPPAAGRRVPGTDVASSARPRARPIWANSSSRGGSGIARDCRAPSAIACLPAPPGSLDMPGRRTPDPAPLGARSSQSGCLSLYNSQVLANAPGLGCNCSDDMLTSRRTHMSGMPARSARTGTVRAPGSPAHPGCMTGSSCRLRSGVGGVDDE